MINHAVWNDAHREFYKDRPELWEFDIKYMNGYIDLYNSLPENSEEKDLVLQYLIIMFSWPVKEYIDVDLWVEPNAEFTKEDEKRSIELHRKIEEIRERYKNAIN